MTVTDKRRDEHPSVAYAGLVLPLNEKRGWAVVNCCICWSGAASTTNKLGTKEAGCSSFEILHYYSSINSTNIIDCHVENDNDR